MNLGVEIPQTFLENSYLLGKYSQVISTRSQQMIQVSCFEFFKYQAQFLDFVTSFLYRDGVNFKYPMQSLMALQKIKTTKAFFNFSPQLQESIVQLFQPGRLLSSQKLMFPEDIEEEKFIQLCFTLTNPSTTYFEIYFEIQAKDNKNVRISETFCLNDQHNHAFVLQLPLELVSEQIFIVIKMFENQQFVKEIKQDLKLFTNNNYEQIKPDFVINDDSSVADDNLYNLQLKYNPFKEQEQLFTPFSPFRINVESLTFNCTFLNYFIFDKPNNKIILLSEAKLSNQLRHDLQGDYYEKIAGYEIVHCIKLLLQRDQETAEEVIDENRVPSLNLHALHCARLLIQQPQLMNLIVMQPTTQNCLFATNAETDRLMYVKELQMLPNAFEQLKKPRKQAVSKNFNNQIYFNIHSVKFQGLQGDGFCKVTCEVRNKECFYPQLIKKLDILEFTTDVVFEQSQSTMVYATNKFAGILDSSFKIEIPIDFVMDRRLSIELKVFFGNSPNSLKLLSVGQISLIDQNVKGKIPCLVKEDSIYDCNCGQATVQCSYQLDSTLLTSSIHYCNFLNSLNEYRELFDLDAEQWKTRNVQVAQDMLMHFQYFSTNAHTGDRSNFQAEQQTIQDFKHSKHLQKYIQTFPLILFTVFDILWKVCNFDDEKEKDFREKFRENAFISSDEESQVNIKKQIEKINSILNDQERVQRRQVLPLLKSRKERQLPQRRGIVSLLQAMIKLADGESKQVSPKQLMQDFQKLQLNAFKGVDVNLLTHIERSERQQIIDYTQYGLEKQLKCKAGAFNDISSLLKFGQYLNFGVQIPEEDDQTTFTQQIINHYLKTNDQFVFMFMKAITKSLFKNESLLDQGCVLVKILSNAIYRLKLDNQQLQRKQIQDFRLLTRQFLSIFSKQLQNYISSILDDQSHHLALVQLSKELSKFLLAMTELTDVDTCIECVQLFLCNLFKLNSSNTLTLKQILQQDELFEGNQKQCTVLTLKLVIVPFLSELLIHPITLTLETQFGNSLLEIAILLITSIIRAADSNSICQVVQLFQVLVLNFTQTKSRLSEATQKLLLNVVLDNVQIVKQYPCDYPQEEWQKAQRTMIVCFVFLLTPDRIKQFDKATLIKSLEILEKGAKLFSTSLMISQCSIQNAPPEMDSINVAVNVLSTFNSAEIIEDPDDNINTYIKSLKATLQALFYTKTVEQQISSVEAPPVEEIEEDQKITQIKQKYAEQLNETYNILQYQVLKQIISKDRTPEIIVGVVNVMKISAETDNSQVILSIQSTLMDELFNLITVTNYKELQLICGAFFVVSSDQEVDIIKRIYWKFFEFIRNNALKFDYPTVSCQNTEQIQYFAKLQEESLLIAPTEVQPLMSQYQRELYQYVVDYYDEQKNIYFKNAQGVTLKDDAMFYQSRLSRYKRQHDIQLLYTIGNEQTKNKKIADAAHTHLLILFLQASTQSDDPLNKMIMEFVRKNEPRFLDYPPPTNPRSQLELLEQVQSLFQQAQYIYYASFFLELLIIYQKDKTKQQLKQLRDQQEKLKLELQLEKQASMKILAFYYKITLYGPGFGSEDTKTFIFSEPASCRTADFQQKITKYYAEKLQVAPKVVMTSKFEPPDKNNYIQLSSMTPFPLFSEAEKLTDPEYKFSKQLMNEIGCDFRERISPFQDATHNRIFYSSAPHFTAKDKDKAENVGRVMKFCVVQEELPGIVSKQLVVKEFQETWDPIKHNTELIKDQYVMLKTRCILQEKLKMNEIQIALQGSVMVQVNAGPLYLAKKYLKNIQLGTEAEIQTTPEQQQNLHLLLKLFTEQAGQLVKIGNEKATGDKQFIVFQASIDESYKKLHQDMSVYVQFERKEAVVAAPVKPGKPVKPVKK
ncbi:dedicator_of cytokinesis protein [Hexamita inflata]|uniref:Dedicator of cytokinesis protein n=1 Tax=Hexamita inflata TaxID=28002 RepID=A0AA86TWE7_9EUKA|nr:dedicator of cytokinesis protein [Hexamita inflata]